MEEPAPIDPAKARAISDLNDIRALRSNLPFNRYFTREAQAKIAELTTALTAYPNTLSEQQREGMLGELHTWRRIAGKLDADEIANQNIAG